MKLELFDFIDETLELMDLRRSEIELCADVLENFFANSLFINDHFLNVNYRVKSKESLREKILRNNYYLKHGTSENLLNNLSDLVGVRIECRFIEDEGRIYEDIKKLFNVEMEEGYYASSLNSSILLKLGVKQPQIQKNGFEIYKIDGKYSKDEVTINFELQIKSMVNMFWGEIDHKILYKNFNYIITEDFFRDIMVSIKDNLSMIDRQLMLVYNHANGMDTSNTTNKRIQLKAFLSKMIHDIYLLKVRNELGFVVDFKKTTDIIVDYIFMKDGREDDESYSESFLRVLNKLGEIAKEDIVFNQYIEFEEEMFFNDAFTRKIGTAIKEVINKDFRWNLFFRIIFEIEEGNNVEDFQKFMIFIRYRFYEKLTHALGSMSIVEEDKDVIIEEVLDCIAVNLCDDLDVDHLSNERIDGLASELCQIFKDIDTYEEWIDNKVEITNNILEYKF